MSRSYTFSRTRSSASAGHFNPRHRLPGQRPFVMPSAVSKATPTHSFKQATPTQRLDAGVMQALKPPQNEPARLAPKESDEKALMPDRASESLDRAAPLPDRSIAAIEALPSSQEISSIQLKRGKTVSGTRPAKVKYRRARTDVIDDAYGKGSLTKEQWAKIYKQAQEAEENNRWPYYLQLYKDVAKLAQAPKLGMFENKIHYVKDENVLQPGLNLSFRDGENATTYFIDAKGKHENLSLANSGPSLEIAIVLRESAFRPEKAHTLATLRHELMHAEHKLQARSVFGNWARKKKSRTFDPKTERQFIKWLDKQRRIPKWQKALINDGFTSRVTYNTEVLGHVEGFMTAFHLVDDPHDKAQTDYIFLGLLGARSTKILDNWVKASPDVRAEALGRLQEYYCNTLGPKHRQAFRGWLRAQRQEITMGQILHHEKSEADGKLDSNNNPAFDPASEPLRDDQWREMHRKTSRENVLQQFYTNQQEGHTDFIASLDKVIDNKCKGFALEGVVGLETTKERNRP